MRTPTTSLRVARLRAARDLPLFALAAVAFAPSSARAQNADGADGEPPPAQKREAAAARPASGSDGAGDVQDLEPAVVSATRTATPISEVTRSVTTVTREALERQAELDANLSSILAQKVPGMGPSTEAVSNFGQSLRGRNFLVLIDGVPQSTPLRDGFRDLNTIAPSAIERIEVVRGGTAAYGFGASGGLVNIITKEASREPLAGRASAGASFSTEHAEDSAEYRSSHRVSGTKGPWDYVASAGYIERKGRFDAEGRRIPPDPLGAQGGFADTEQWNFLGKLGYAFDAGDQRLELMANYFDVAQDTDFRFGPQAPNARRTTAVRGDLNIESPGTENAVLNLNYRNKAWLGGTARANVYYGDQTAVFSKFPGFPQSEIASEKYGARFTADTPVARFLDGAAVLWGADFVHDDTTQRVFGPGATADAVDLSQDALAGFAEAEVSLGERFTLRGGVRHEVIEVDASTIDPNTFGNTVLAGELDFDETLLNLSGVYSLTESTELFGGFSQGFSLNDLGRSLNDAGPFGAGATFRAERFETEAEKVDHFELGLRKTRGDFRYTLAAFYSESDNGATFDQNLAIQKTAEEIWGFEASADYRFDEQWKIGATVSFSEGESETGGAERDLPNTRIAPEKITAHLSYAPFAWWHNRLQAQYVGDRNPDSNAFGSGEVDGYAVVDWIAEFELGPGRLKVSAENLLNEDYFPAVNQAFNRSFSFAKAPGRRVGVSYELPW